jgi:hypothetical protein
LHSVPTNFHEPSRGFNQMGFIAERSKPKRIWPGAASNISHDSRRSWQESLHDALRSLELKLPLGGTQPVMFGVFDVILLYGTFRVFRHSGATRALSDCSRKLGRTRQSRRTRRVTGHIAY